ncbi:MAG: substrate-binding domain-containing protein [Burkholderiales bacterium]|nr:substrate-binding domain-containing protein [Phycisphaerae bacterium]
MKVSLLVVFSCVVALAPVAHAEDLTIVGTGDGIPVLKALGSAFTSEKQDIKIIVPPSIHSSGGVREVAGDRAVLGRIARPLKDDEKGFGFRVVPIFRQPAVFYVHKSAGVKDLSAEQLVRIYTGAVTNWRDVGGADLRIRVVRREEVDSTLAVLRDTLPGWKDLQFQPDRSMLATSTQDAFDAVRSNAGAIGFGPYSTDLESVFTVLRVNGISPTEPNYPSAVPLLLIYKDTTVTKSALAFIDFIFTAKGKTAIKENGALPVARETKPTT